MTGHEIGVYAPGAPPRAVHMGTSEADMVSHLNAVEGNATCDARDRACRGHSRPPQPLDYLPGLDAHRERASRAGGERMKVQIRVVYWGRNRFVVRVLKDGVTLEQQPATRATVKARRKLVCDRWSKLGYEVEAEAIPDAWDLRG